MIDKLPLNYNHIDYKERKLVREEYIRLQHYTCYYCGEFLFNDPPDNILNKKIIKSLFPKNFFDHSIHLHHNHNTGMTIGAVHSYCNAVLWQYDGE